MWTFTRKRECFNVSGSLKRRCVASAAPSIPLQYSERELDEIKHYDKVFASAWVDHSTFVIGTKDNKLIRWDTDTGKHVNIPLPDSPQPRHRDRQDNCGIHSIAVSPSRTLLATGGSNPDDVAIFKLPSFDPVAILQSHENWMFAAAWVGDSHLITGSRDSTVKLWSICSDEFLNQSPIVTRTDHDDKVRDLKYCLDTETVTTLSQDGTCKLWDPHEMLVVSSIRCPDPKELVCMAVKSPLVAVGSQRFITFIDMRCGHVVKSIASADEGWGVRSLSFQDNVVTCGGGKGRLSFLDTRTQKYIRIREINDSGCTGENHMDTISYSTGTGHVVKDQVYAEHFAGQDIKHAVYTHSQDFSRTSLLVAGGPLPYGLKGGYVGIW
ncbi:unnamed protein product [Closterium sp. NIES-54]